MEFTINAPGGNELQITETIPSPNALILPSASIMGVKAAFGDMIFQQYNGAGFSIWFSNYHILHATEMTGRGDVPVLELHMQLVNGFYTQWDGVGEKWLKSHQYNLTYTPFLFNKVKFAGGKDYHTFDIHFTLAFLEQLSPDYPVLQRFLEKVSKGIATHVFNLDRFMSPTMINIVHRMLHCPYSGRVADHFFKSSVEQLLIEALYESETASSEFSSYDRDCIFHAKELAIQDFGHPFTIIELAHKVGINDNKLKKGFKHFFGTTIFNYVQVQRLEAARLALLETSHPIEDIAIMAGYNHTSNFKKAFQKHFGYTAAYLRKHKTN